MPINSDKPAQWKDDIIASVDMFNTWFMTAAPKAFRETRLTVTKLVEGHLIMADDCRAINAALLTAHPAVVGTLRMATAPPLARERLSGLAGVSKGLVEVLESGRLPAQMPATDLNEATTKLGDILCRLLDDDLFPWVAPGQLPTEKQRFRAATIVADRKCGAVADPIIKNAQEQRQLALVKAYLEQRGYVQATAVGDPKQMKPGTFSFRMNVVVKGGNRSVNIPVDILIQPKQLRTDQMPILIEAKSAGDFTNVNKRRKEEAQKIHQIRATYGASVPFYLFLCGYFDAGYLGYSASEGIDWIWEHRIGDLAQTGI